MFFVPAGCVQSIGAGCLILEIQQSSDITYRIYDYNRLQDNGLPRELHTELALDAIDFDSNAVIKITPKLLSDGVYKAVNSKYFNVNIRHINGDDYLDVSDKDSFVILSCVEGALHYTYKDMEDTLMEGETILLPAIIEGITLQTEKQSKLIEIFISDKDNN